MLLDAHLIAENSDARAFHPVSSYVQQDQDFGKNLIDEIDSLSRATWY